MANLKNITELPVAESAEGLNLIVNDNGSAKQIAASAVGAQADWAVNDETSPAFIKNKPGYAQADWEETDESSASYIRNKTHYVERNVLVNVLPETTYTLMEMDGTFEAQLPSDMNLIANKTYQIHYNGTSYECTSMDFELPGSVFLGNPAMLGGPDNGMPFAMIVIPGMGGYLISPVDSEVTLSISYIGDQYHTLDPNYIKDMYSSERVENVEILPETTLDILSDDVTYLYDFTNPLVAGNYTINWNGTEYICTSFFEDQYGILLFVDGVFDLYWHPLFEMGDNRHSAELRVFDGSTSVTLSITGPSEKVKKINSKYLDIPSYIVNEISLEEQLNNLQNQFVGKYNPVFSGSFSMNRKNNTEIGDLSHAEGRSTTASGIGSHAEGSNTTASGEYSHAEGVNTKATNSTSDIERTSIDNSGYTAHAEGFGTVASGRCSHAEGNGTKASGIDSHAEGYATIASGSSSHASGYYTRASGENSFVSGKYNIEDSNSKYVHIVGNGDTQLRSNAHTLDWNGVPWYQSRPQFGGIAQDDGSQTVMANGDKEIILASSTAGSAKKFKITVDDSGTITATEVT